MLEIIKPSIFSISGRKYIGELIFSEGKIKERFQLYSDMPNQFIRMLLGDHYAIISKDELQHLETLIQLANKKELWFSDYKYYKMLFPLSLHLFLNNHVEWNRSKSFPIRILGRENECDGTELYLDSGMEFQNFLKKKEVKRA